MKTSLKFPIGICFFLILDQISWSKGVSTSKSVSTDCPKFAEDLCANFQRKSESDTLWVNINLRQPFAPLPDSCKGIDLRTHPDSNCVEKADSTFWARLKQENTAFYNEYSSMMFDLYHPSQTLSYPGDSAWIFIGVSVTKSNLVTISQDTSLIEVSAYFFEHTATLHPLRTTILPGNRVEKWTNFTVNGQAIRPTDRPRTFLVKIPR